jgi:hypothetical protein
VTAGAGDRHAPHADPDEVVARVFRMLGFGLLLTAIVIDALEGPRTRWRRLRRAAIDKLDPLEPPGSALPALAAELLSLADGSGAPKPR